MHSRLFRTGILRANRRKIALVSLTSAFAASQTLHADAPVERTEPIRKLPFSNILRAYVVYALCSVPPVVDYGPAILNFCSSVPGLSQVSREIVRATFFAQASVQVLTRPSRANQEPSLSAEKLLSKAYLSSNDSEEKTRPLYSHTASKWMRLLQEIRCHTRLR